METENMNPEDIFHKAIEIANTTEREAYLNKACGKDEKLRADVKELLKAHEQAGDFLEMPAIGPNATLDNSPLTEGPGTIIGRYKLLQLIGEGGFGCVYMADQEEPIRRKVALKIIKLGMDTKQVITRFEVERQALAMMEHPNIARVFDAGATDTGRPYFVMELVKGVPITEYCDKNNLNTRQRLELFVDVCKAVQHAHQKGIIHRDIKPSNVMITLQDGKPMPKIIDFGIAKATQHRLTEKTFFTEYRQFIGTPEYMSPEQAEMSALDIDTRTDIYSLGVLLYELLTGVTPFDAKQLREAGYAEIQRIIRETEPLKPSTKLSTMGDALNDVAKHRHMQPGELCKIVRGDLDWVVMKAMEKDRTRRYETANELAADISRHIADEPVSAGPPSARYRLRKFVRRNRAFVTGISAVLAVLVAGIVVSTIFAVGQARARARAEFHAAMLHATMEYFQSGFFVKGADATVGEVVETLAKNLELLESRKGSSDPSLKDFYGAPLPLMAASTHLALGNMYVGLEKYEQAELHLEQAFRFFQKQLGWKHEVTQHSMKDLALLYLRQGRYDEAEPLLAKVLETSRRMNGDHHDEMLYYSINDLGREYFLQGRYNDAEALLVKALEISRRVWGEEHPCTLDSMYRLAPLYIEQGRYGDADNLLAKMLETQRRILGEEDASTLGTIAFIGWLRYKQGQFNEAETLLVKTLETQHRLLGEQSTLFSAKSLGFVYCQQGRYDEAESLLSKGLETSRRLLGEEDLNPLHFMTGLGLVYFGQRRYDEAEALLTKVMEVTQRRFGGEHWRTLETMNELGVLYREQDRYTEAEDLFRKALNSRRRVLGDEHPDTLTSMSDLALLYLKQGRYDEAEPLALNCYQGRSAKLGPEYVFTQEAIQVLVNLYDAWGKPEQAEQWRAKLPDKNGSEEQ